MRCRYINAVVLMAALLLAGCSGPDMTRYASRELLPNPEGAAKDTFGKNQKVLKGKESSESYYDAQGYPALDKDGVHKRVYTYDESGNRTAESYFGLDGKAVVCRYKYHKRAWEYDKNGQKVSESYWGINGEPVKNNQGIHEKRWDYAGGEAPPFEEEE